MVKVKKVDGRWMAWVPLRSAEENQLRVWAVDRVGRKVFAGDEMEWGSSGGSRLKAMP